jgi:hypothetical protein
MININKISHSPAFAGVRKGPDVFLSRRKQGFESPWERHPFIRALISNSFFGKWSHHRTSGTPNRSSFDLFHSGICKPFCICGSCVSLNLIQRQMTGD